jgi:hypothetical protein
LLLPARLVRPEPLPALPLDAAISWSPFGAMSINMNKISRESIVKNEGRVTRDEYKHKVVGKLDPTGVNGLADPDFQVKTPDRQCIGGKCDS